MTPQALANALAAGFERLAAWSDLLDAINVFPVADGDTGRNLVLTLSPLRDAGQASAPAQLAEELLLAARGNSGNIAARFLAEFLTQPEADLAARCARAGRAARAAVHQPREGTMLTFFDALAADLADTPADFASGETVARLDRLARMVAATREALPRLAAAGVVDAGALGMFLFFEAFFGQLAGLDQPGADPLERFGPAVALAEGYAAENEAAGSCVDVVLRPGRELKETMAALDGAAEEVVAIPHGAWVKLHFHTRSGAAVRRRMEAAGQVLQWEEDDLADQARRFSRQATAAGVHLVTDAAASLTRADQQRLGITLLDSYIHDGRRALPETRLRPADVYRALRAGVRVTTAQASIRERHQFYARLAAQHVCVIYLCVGSAYTGNFNVASRWAEDLKAAPRFIVVDSGAASGRLAVMAIPAARLARDGAGPDVVREALQHAMQQCREYIFLDRLKYLAAGGRLSRPGAFFGDLLHVKPVISPQPSGVERVGAVRSAREQVTFALDRLALDLAGRERPLILLQYSDNEAWLRQTVAPGLQERFPQAELVIQPLSLTTGVHTGPGSWAVALHPEPDRLLKNGA